MLLLTVKKNSDRWIRRPGITVFVLIQGLTMSALPPPNFRHYFVLYQGSKSIQLAKSVQEQGYHLPNCLN